MNFYIMNHDFKSKKYRYFINFYLKVLNIEVAPTYARLDPGYIFIQDNTAIYTTYKVHNWFSNFKITTVTN